MGNKWLAHLAQYRKINKDMNPQELMKNARKSYQSGGNPSPYVQNMNKMSPMPVGANDPIRMFGGAVVPFEPAGTDSRPASVGGRRRTRRQRRSRRTRRR